MNPLWGKVNKTNKKSAIFNPFSDVLYYHLKGIFAFSETLILLKMDQEIDNKSIYPTGASEDSYSVCAYKKHTKSIVGDARVCGYVNHWRTCFSLRTSHNDQMFELLHLSSLKFWTFPFIFIISSFDSSWSSVWFIVLLSFLQLWTSLYIQTQWGWWLQWTKLASWGWIRSLLLQFNQQICTMWMEMLKRHASGFLLLLSKAKRKKILMKSKTSIE